MSSIEELTLALRRSLDVGSSECDGPRNKRVRSPRIRYGAALTKVQSAGAKRPVTERWLLEIQNAFSIPSQLCSNRASSVRDGLFGLRGFVFKLRNNTMPSIRILRRSNLRQVSDMTDCSLPLADFCALLIGSLPRCAGPAHHDDTDRYNAEAEVPCQSSLPASVEVPDRSWPP